MRKIGACRDQKTARRFVAYLAKEGIEAEVREESESEASVWGHHEDDLARAKAYFSEFQANPEDKRFNAPPPRPPKPEKLPPQAGRARYIDVRSEVFGKAGSSLPVTWTFIGISVVLTMIIELPAYAWLRDELMYSNYIRPMFFEIRKGEIWRLITPIFLHAGLLHIVFNMLWLHTLGGQIERQEGSFKLLIFMLVTAVLVNTAQYLVTPAPFLGMSGVVYALFGYVWMMIKYRVGCRYELSDFTVKLMLFWLVFCLFLPNVANTQHFVGAALGAGFGLIHSGGLKGMIRRWKYRNKLKP